MVMRAKKIFVVVAYDIADEKRRNHIVRILEKVGIRVNYSVFECLLTDIQFEKLQEDVGHKINSREDRIAYYPVCVNCYTKIVYQPNRNVKYDKVLFV